MTTLGILLACACLRARPESSSGPGIDLPPPRVHVDPLPGPKATVDSVVSTSCPWPPQAELVNSASVILRVEVSPSGTAQRVIVLADPGHGFGAQAQECALAANYRPALDDAGIPLASTATIRMHFQR